MADYITGFRILCGFLILFIPGFGPAFYVFYLLGGLSDMIDGPIARKTGKANENGAIYDTVADMVFAIAVVIKIVKDRITPKWFLPWIAVIIIIKVAAILIGYSRHRRIVTVHSIMNKAAGAIIFASGIIIVIDIPWQVKLVVIVIAGIVATAAAALELYSIICGKIAEKKTVIKKGDENKT